MKKTFVLTVSEFFPKAHPKAGLPTGFVMAIAKLNKIHTIRGNYELWRKRAEKINNGEAVLSVRCWTGKPYNSKQREVFVFEKIGVEKLQLDILGWFIDDVDSDYRTEDIAKNDGLSVADFKDWFKGQDFTQPKAIIHFSKFRYLPNRITGVQECDASKADQGGNDGNIKNSAGNINEIN